MKRENWYLELLMSFYLKAFENMQVEYYMCTKARVYCLNTV